jgi:predicted dehydrogenase
MRKMRFFQSNAYISVDFLEGNCEIYELISAQNDTQKEGISFTYGKIGEGTNAKEIRYRRYEKKDINPLNYELTLFLKSIIDNTETIVSGEEAVRALKVADDILKNIAAHAQLVKEKWHNHNGH